MPAWVVPVTFLDGYMVVDDREGDGKGLTDASLPWRPLVSLWRLLQSFVNC